MGHFEDDAVHKIPHKMNQLKSCWFDLISSIELDIKRWMLHLSNAPLIIIYILFVTIATPDCYTGNGHSYRGEVSFTSSGERCFNWGDLEGTGLPVGVTPAGYPNTGMRLSLLNDVHVGTLIWRYRPCMLYCYFCNCFFFCLLVCLFFVLSCTSITGICVLPLAVLIHSATELKHMIGHLPHQRNCSHMLNTLLLHGSQYSNKFLVRMCHPGFQK